MATALTVALSVDGFSGARSSSVQFCVAEFVIFCRIFGDRGIAERLHMRARGDQCIRHVSLCVAHV